MSSRIITQIRTDLNRKQGFPSTLDFCTPKRFRCATNFEKLYNWSLFEEWNIFEVWNVRCETELGRVEQFWTSDLHQLHFPNSWVKFINDYEINLCFEKFITLFSGNENSVLITLYQSGMYSDHRNRKCKFSSSRGSNLSSQLQLFVKIQQFKDSWNSSSLWPCRVTQEIQYDHPTTHIY